MKNTVLAGFLAALATFGAVCWKVTKVAVPVGVGLWSALSSMVRNGRR